MGRFNLGQAVKPLPARFQIGEMTMENQNDQMLMTMRRELTGGQKAGYFFAGLLGGVGCAILASLCNINAPYRSDCTKFSLIGVGIGIVLSGIGTIAALPFAAILY